MAPMEGYGTSRSHASQSMVSDACHMTYCGSMVTVDWQLFAISAEQRTYWPAANIVCRHCSKTNCTEVCEFLR